MSDGNPARLDDIIDHTWRFAARSLRRAQLAAARVAATATEGMRRKAKELEIRLEGLHKGLDIKPVSDVSFPAVDPASCTDPVSEIMAAPTFAAAVDFFNDNPAAARSLISAQAQALLYCLIRNLRPQHVFEIGTYKAGTTEAICRALQLNGIGIAHAVDPFQGEYIAGVLKFWPPELFRHVRLHLKDSMAFFADMERQRIHPDLVFVDGNHEYEYAAFDIACGARLVAPRGFIFVDNISQPGPFFAALDFLAANPGWRARWRGHALQSRQGFRSWPRHTVPAVALAPLIHIDQQLADSNFGAFLDGRRVVDQFRVILEPRVDFHCLRLVPDVLDFIDAVRLRERAFRGVIFD